MSPVKVNKNPKTVSHLFLYSYAIIMVWRSRTIIIVTTSEESNSRTTEGWRQQQQHEQHADATTTHAEKHDPRFTRVSFLFDHNL